MVREKSKAVIKSARLNPVNQPEADALKIIDELEQQGYSFKTIVVDAILMADGRTPEMYTSNTQAVSTQILGQLDRMFSQFAHEIISQIKRGGIQSVMDEDEDDSAEHKSRFAESFARSFLERQRRAMGDE